MKSAFAALATILLAVASPAAADSVTFDFVGGFGAIDQAPDSVSLYVTAGDSSLSPRLFDGIYTAADVGTTFVELPGSAGFDFVTGFLSDGDLNDRVYVWFTTPLVGGGNSRLESDATGFPAPPSDLLGYDITHITLTFNSLTFGIMNELPALTYSADLTFHYTASVVPTPSAAFGGLALLALAGLRRR